MFELPYVICTLCLKKNRTPVTFSNNSNNPGSETKITGIRSGFKLTNHRSPLNITTATMCVPAVFVNAGKTQTRGG